MNKRSVEQRLAGVETFAEPTAALEQYPTPPDVAAHLLHLAAMRGDVDGATVLDLGAGTGTLALAAALYEPAAVLAVERDREALATAVENERRVDPPVAVSWLHADATALPVFPRPDSDPPSRRDTRQLTVVSNPPFGAQDGNEHADRRFLTAIADAAVEVDGSTHAPVVSYTLHNAGSRSFVESFVADADATVTDAFAVTLPLSRQFGHHAAERVEIDTELFRVEW